MENALVKQLQPHRASMEKQRLEIQKILDTAQAFFKKRKTMYHHVPIKAKLVFMFLKFVHAGWRREESANESESSRKVG